MLPVLPRSPVPFHSSQTRSPKSAELVIIMSSLLCPNQRYMRKIKHKLRSPPRSISSYSVCLVFPYSCAHRLLPAENINDAGLIINSNKKKSIVSRSHPKIERVGIFPSMLPRACPHPDLASLHKTFNNQENVVIP